MTPASCLLWSQYIKVSLNLIKQVCVCDIITAGVNDAEREGQRSGTDEMYLPSPEILIKEQSFHITSHHLGPSESNISLVFILHCRHLQVFALWGCRADVEIVS